MAAGIAIIAIVGGLACFALLLPHSAAVAIIAAPFAGSLLAVIVPTLVLRRRAAARPADVPPGLR